MDVKLSSTSSSTNHSAGKQLDFCGDPSGEHGYSSLENLNCQQDISFVHDYDPTSSSISAATTLLTTSSSPFNSPAVAAMFSGSIPDQSNAKSSSSSQSSTTPDANSPSHRHYLYNGKMANDSDDYNNDRITVDSSASEDNFANPAVIKPSECSQWNKGTEEQRVTQSKGTGSDEPHSQVPQPLQSGNRFRFVPKSRQVNVVSQETKSSAQHSSHHPNGPRGQRRSTRSESEIQNHHRGKHGSARHRNNEDVVFIIRKVDRSLRRTVSESSSGETLPVRGILKYPRDWDRRTLSESSCDRHDQSNLLESHENGVTQSLECISPLEASCETSTESACSSAGESPGHDEDYKPKKSVHFNCYVSKATFNINSIILNNKSSGNHKKKNRKRDNSTTNNNNSHKQNLNHKIGKNHSKQPKQHNNGNHPNTSNTQQQQQNPTKQLSQNGSEVNQNGPKTCPKSDDKEATNPHGATGTTTINPGSPVNIDATEQSENIDPMEFKMRSRQDSGYDSETNDRKGFTGTEVEGSTCIAPVVKRQFTVKKVDLNK